MQISSNLSEQEITELQQNFYEYFETGYAFEEFLKDIDLIVIMVKHDEIKNNLPKIKKKVILDTQNICDLPNTYKL